MRSQERASIQGIVAQERVRGERPGILSCAILSCASSGYNPAMDKKEINSPKLTANFLFWICGVGGLLLLAFLGHYVWRIF
jgi:hypothetical protein